MTEPVLKCARCSGRILDDDPVVFERGEIYHAHCFSILAANERLRSSKAVSREARASIEKARERIQRSRETLDREADDPPLRCRVCHQGILSAASLVVDKAGPVHAWCAGSAVQEDPARRPAGVEGPRAETFLQERAGLFFCAACLAHGLGIPAFEGRQLVWRLRALPDYVMHGARCSTCSRGKRCIRYVGRSEDSPRATEGTAGRVLAFLRDNASIYLCDACLAFSVEHGIGAVRDAADSMAALADVDRREGRCTVCSRLTLVTARVDRDDT